MDTFLSKLFNKFNVSKKEVLLADRFFPNSIPEQLEPVQQEAWETYVKNAILVIANSIQVNFDTSDFNSKNGIYLGTAGVAYMFYHLSRIPVFKDFQNEFLRKAQDYIKPAINEAVKNSHKTKNCPSLLLGNCGIYAISAAVYLAADVQWLSNKYYKIYQKGAEVCTKLQFLKCGSDDFFVGRAGYILGQLWLSKELGKSLDINKLYKICDVIILSGLEYAKKHKCPTPLMYSYYKTEYIGAAHGLSTILLALLSVPNYLNTNPSYSVYIKETVDYVLSLQDSEGNFPLSITQTKVQNNLTQWCHGAAGVIYLMAKAYLVWKEHKYLESCEKAAEQVWTRGLLTKGPGLCHGVSGNGYTFLLMYRLTQDQRYLNKAFAFAKFMESEEFKELSKIPDNPYSLFEGVAGTACFLSDLLAPNTASFPFLDVFAVYSVFNRSLQ